MLRGYHTTFPHCPLHKRDILQNAGHTSLLTVDKRPALPAVVSKPFFHLVIMLYVANMIFLVPG